MAYTVPFKEGKWAQEGKGVPYESLIGTPYLKAQNRTLFYPSYFKLHLESMLYKLPLTLILILLYLCTLWRSPLIFIAFSLHSLLLLARIYILGRPPVSNMMETVLYVPWITVLSSLPFFRYRYLICGASIVSALLLLFYPLHQQFENVQAVLDSGYWLFSHVLMVVGSYGVFFLAGLMGHIYFVWPQDTLFKIMLQMMYIGTGLLIVGTVLGGVWALNSWGRFWDWDPKESWAFISSGLYLIWIHAYKFGVIRKQTLATGAIIGLMTITFTWYGVNYILGTGLHSYGFGEGGHTLYFLYLGGEILFLMAALKIKNIFYKKKRTLFTKDKHVRIAKKQPKQ
ncbi:MAG: cytochrome c biogenesis protein [Chlamydiales bacterium]